ncbi:MAG: AraC family transcriptional regulator [Aeromicrobium sp.]
MAANEYPRTANTRSAAGSPILSLGHRSDSDDMRAYENVHSHPEPKLLWTSSATLSVTTASRTWLIPPGYGLWIPGGHDHGVATLRFGAGSIITFAPDRCPIDWVEPTGVEIGPLLLELIAHLQGARPDDATRGPAETLMFALLTPLPTHDINLSMPLDLRIRTIAERLVADPADARELAFWADEVHASVRTLSRLFRAETGLSFAQWRTQARIRAAIHLLADGEPVNVTARAVGYTKPSAFIDTFRRVTGQTPGTYLKGPAALQE